MSPSNHSAEFLRGAVAALQRRPYSAYTTSVLLAEYQALLSAAEAREAGKPTAEEVIAACRRAVLQIGKWDQFSDHEKAVVREAMKALAAWEAARR